MNLPEPGSRVRLLSTTDQYTRLCRGDLGTVTGQVTSRISPDAACYTILHVRWDSGSTLSLIGGVDRWEEVQ